MDISVYLVNQGLFQAATALSPRQRDKLLEYAFSMLTCEFGHHCGSHSLDVRLAFFGMGVCQPGANLQDIYKQEMLSGQEWRVVQAVLNYPRQIEPTMTARWQ